LGSSATAIVGGLIGANILAGEVLTLTQIMELAIEIEGHPDNVVPALLGGCRLAATSDKGWEICDIPWSKDVIPVVAIPDFELSTSEARQVLPTQVSRSDAIFNTAHLGLLLRGLETGNQNWLRAALQDKLHQPYRKKLINNYDAINAAALSAGAYGMVISGAGPTLLALTNTANSQAVAAAMAHEWQNKGIKAQVQTLQIDNKGATSIVQG
jgi:homoserine kinase